MDIVLSSISKESKIFVDNRGIQKAIKNLIVGVKRSVKLMSLLKIDNTVEHKLVVEIIALSRNRNKWDWLLPVSYTHLRAHET